MRGNKYSGFNDEDKGEKTEQNKYKHMSAAGHWAQFPYPKVNAWSGFE